VLQEEEEEEENSRAQLRGYLFSVFRYFFISFQKSKN
jgi:hypothetical protein